MRSKFGTCVKRMSITLDSLHFFCIGKKAKICAKAHVTIRFEYILVPGKGKRLDDFEGL